MIATAAVVGLAFLTPVAGSAPAQCSMRLTDPKGHAAGARVLAFLTDDQAQAAIVRTQNNLGGTIDPAYVGNVRVRVRVERKGITIALVPSDMHVKVGQRVTFVTAHVNAALPCNYIPNLIVHPAIS